LDTAPTYSHILLVFENFEAYANDLGTGLKSGE
jgi:hypothetical protein